MFSRSLIWCVACELVSTLLARIPTSYVVDNAALNLATTADAWVQTWVAWPLYHNNLYLVGHITVLRLGNLSRNYRTLIIDLTCAGVLW